MPQPKITLLNSDDKRSIHELSIKILDTVGVVVPHLEILNRLAEVGIRVNFDKKLVKIDETKVNSALASTPKKYIVYGTDRNKVARYGYGDINVTSSPGQFTWFDHHSGKRREPLLEDAKCAARVGDVLSNITIVGAMAVPVNVPRAIRDVILTSELIKVSSKPTRCWPIDRKSSHYVLEIYSVLAGGKEELKKTPMVETFLEPISPLQFPETGLDVMLEFLEHSQPVAIGPMAMVSGTAPATLAGTLAQENAEILASIVIIQSLKPGTPITYGGIPHIMDPRTSICSFGSPEQGLMAAAMAQMSKFYELPVYLNINLTDAKSLDAQAGMEKMGSFLMGALIGADLIGHAGIVGADHGGSLPWLVIDNEAVNYVKRIRKGFDIDEETFAANVISEIGPGGNFLAHKHTVQHFRKELWIPDPIWTRDTFDNWLSKERAGMYERAVDQVDHILNQPIVEQLDTTLSHEIDSIVKSAWKELV